MSSIISSLVVAAAIAVSPQEPPSSPPAGGPCAPGMCRPVSPKPPKHVHGQQPRPCERCGKPQRSPKPEPRHKHRH